LSFDGGGILGVLTLVVLERIMREFLIFWHMLIYLPVHRRVGLSRWDWRKECTRDIRALYEGKGATIFRDSWVDDALDFGNMIGANYDNRGR
jgi:hypothetical protein